jgi:hypothetical protein
VESDILPQLVYSLAEQNVSIMRQDFQTMFWKDNTTATLALL